MHFPTINNALATWRGESTLHAVKENEETVFYVENQQGKVVSRHSIEQVLGWIPPDEIRLCSPNQFYQKLNPLFLPEQALIILTLFMKAVHREEYEQKIPGSFRIKYFNIGQAVGFLENRECRILFLPQTGAPFIPVSEEIALPSYTDIQFSDLHKWNECLENDKWILEKNNLKWLGFQIFIRGLKGETFIIDHNNPQHTVEMIKHKIQVKKDIRSSQQRLIYFGKSLEAKRSLSDCNIQKECTLHLVLRLTGGGLDPLFFNNMECESKIGLTTEGPTWRTIGPGLNLQGTCKNDQCDAYDQEIWIQKGIGTFNLNKECEIAICPQCDQYASNVTNCGFYRCLFSIEGEKGNGEKISRLDIQAPDDALLTFEKGESSLQQWKSLKITTKLPQANIKETKKSEQDSSSSSLPPTPPSSPKSQGGNCILF